MQPVNDQAAYTRGGLTQMQAAARSIGSRARQQVDETRPANWQVKVLGPTGKQLTTFIICNATTQEEVANLVRQQITFKVTQIAREEK